MSKLPDPTYWLSTGGAAEGPYTAPQIGGMFRAGAIPATAQVCPVGSDRWSDVSELVRHVGRSAWMSGVIWAMAGVFAIWILVVVVNGLWRVEKQVQEHREFNEKTFEEMGLGTGNLQ